MTGDAQRCRQPGGADAAHRDPVLRLQRLDDVILALSGGAKPGIDGGHANAGKFRDHLDGARPEPFECRLIAGRDVAFIDILGRGTDGKIAEDGAEQHHALGALGWHRENDGRGEPSGRLVEHHELSAPRRDGEGRGPGHGLDEIAEVPCRIDDDARPQVPGSGGELPALAVMSA